MGVVQRERMQQRTVDAPMPQVLEETVEVSRLVLHELAQQCTVDAPTPQLSEETVEMSSVPHERVQQRSGDFPQSPEETVERERVQQRTAEKFGEVPETASQDWRLQRTLEQAFVDHAETDKIAFQERMSEKMRDQISREYLKCYFKLWVWWISLRTGERVLAEADNVIHRKHEVVKMIKIVHQERE